MAGDALNSGEASDPEARYRWYVLAILMLAYTVHYLDRSVVNAVLEPIRVEFHVSDAALGLLAGPVYAVAFACAGVPLGLLIDRVNRKRLLATLLAGWSALTFVSGFAGGFSMLLAARAAVGAAEAGGSPTAMSLLSDYFPASKRATATGVFFLSVTLGIFLGYLVSGVVAAHHGWRAAFLVAGAPGLLIALLLMATVREPPRGRFDARAVQARPSLLETFSALLGRRALALTLVALVIAATVTGGFNAFVISLLVRRYELGLAEAAIIVSVSLGVFGGLGSVFWGALSDRVAERGAFAPPLLIAITSLIATGFGVFGVLEGSLKSSILGIAGFSLFITSFMGGGYGLLLNLSPPSIRGACTAMAQVLVNLIGVGFGPLVVGGLSSALGASGKVDGLAWALVLVLLLSLVSAACQVGVANALRRSAAAGQSPLPNPLPAPN
ncbi:MFS transporter [Caulobacter vibrioides]|jgi:predicted MFS family arabinose efflux permease|uniref:Sugar phosphate permease n=1 Tax=Caulobacter vibrioides OR37 TaxID=1292034 RepID=R0D138_CAUVI|nr:MFS transporter [Caulobacter vibrioides]ENZ82160.1 sugar phosphate permease [Caulobacter vibrioides OR37]